MRRRPQPERVRERLAPDVSGDYAEEIIRLRGAMKQAIDVLRDNGSGRAAVEARVLLEDTLKREGWWR